MHERLKPKWINPVIAGGLAVAALSGCASKPNNNAQVLSDSLSVAHNHGFEHAIQRGSDPHNLRIQFGACMLPATVSREHLELKVEENMKYNVGAVAAGDKDKLDRMQDNVTSDELGTLTHDGITGLTNCQMTTETIDPLLNQIANANK